MKTIHTYGMLVLLAFANIQAKKIKKPNARIDMMEDNIAFWARQQKEHAQFCVDFTSNDKLKEEGRTIAEKFNQLHTKPQSKNREFLSLTSRIKKFQNNVKNMLKESDKEYSIKIALIDHMNLEANYAEKKVRGKRFSKSEELKFWMEEHKGEAEATAYYMNDDKELKTESDQLAKELKTEIAKPTLALAQDANQELDDISEELNENPEKTRMSGKLAEHEKRERDWAKKIFKKLAHNS
ncbi:MAG: hypothetical protein P4L31_03615 [Candidatus Babeliales bacterium]|nr:hypothetical protein [Candidatus Babeliales bacterium]